MGYRSDIRIKFETVNSLDVQGFIEELRFRLGEDKGLVSDIEIQDHDQVAIIRIDNIKWYDSFEEVHIINTWISELADRAEAWIDGAGDDDDPTVCGIQFLRIGEDLDDNEERYFGELSHPMYINRQFEE